MTRITRHLTGFLCRHGCISKGVLERSSSTVTYLPEANLPVSTDYWLYFHAFTYSFQTRTVGRRHENVVVTLDPSKFAEKKQHRFHIGNHLSFRPNIALRDQLSIAFEMHYNLKLHPYPYPPDTAAFLYYFTSPERPPIAGELRLRVTSSEDHASFESGFDLLALNGQLWSRSLYVVSKFYPPLYEKLREDGLVSDDLDAFLSTLPSKFPRCQILYTLNDTFVIDFSFTQQSLFVITEHGIAPLRFRGPWVDHRDQPNSRAPYTGIYTSYPSPDWNDSYRSVGSALARFERSSLPDHKGSKTVVLRILKKITSLKCAIPIYDRYIPPPKEGELHEKGSNNKLDHQPWSVNIDKPRGGFVRALQLLWDV